MASSGQTIITGIEFGTDKICAVHGVPDENGNIQIERVAYADNLYSEDQENVTDSFLIRTTAGSGSLPCEEDTPVSSPKPGMTLLSVFMTLSACSEALLSCIYQ